MTSRRHANFSGASTYIPSLNCDEYAFRSYLAANKLYRNAVFHPPVRPTCPSNHSSNAGGGSQSQPSCQHRPSLSSASTWRSSIFGAGRRTSLPPAPISALATDEAPSNRPSTSISTTWSSLVSESTSSRTSKPSLRLRQRLSAAKSALFENKYYQPSKESTFAQESYEEWYAQLAQMAGESDYVARQARQKKYAWMAEERRLERYRELLWAKDAQ